MKPSLWQILIIVLIIVLIFGAKRLPDVASSVGKSLKIFKKEVTELREDDDTPGTSGGPVDGSTSSSSHHTGTPPIHSSGSGESPGTPGSAGTHDR